MDETMTEGTQAVAPVDADAAAADSGPLVRRPLLWTVGTALVLTFGFLLIIYALTQLAIGMRPDIEVRNTQTALILYGRIVLVKALWPHVALTAPLYLLIQRHTRLGTQTRLRQCAAFVGLAALTATFITAVILPSTAFEMAAVRPGNATNFVATILELTAGTTAAATAANWLLDRSLGR